MRKFKRWVKRTEKDTLKEIFCARHGVEDVKDLNRWFVMFNKDEYDIGGLDNAVEIIRSHIQTDPANPIVILGDYDVDGVTATSIMVRTLRKIGATNVSYMIPLRSEGFGFNMRMISEIPDGALVITVDNGVASVDETKALMEKGHTVIITDHHEPKVVDGEEIPNPADLVIDPNAVKGQAKFNGYCGAGLAYKLALKLMNGDRNALLNELAMAAIATIADVMVLTEENYVFVHKGLKLLNVDPASLDIGLSAMINYLGLAANVDETSIGYTIAPVINSASRMQDDGANAVVDLFTNDLPYTEALTAVTQLKALNDQRKTEQTAGLDQACAMLPATPSAPIIVKLDIRPTLCGPVAGQLAEKYRMPAIVLTGEKWLTGSARGYGDYDVKGTLDKCASLLTKYGGHKAAAGVSLLKANLTRFRNKMTELSKDFVPEDLNVLYYDKEIVVNDVRSMLDEIAKYAPYGNGNEKFVFLIRNFKTIALKGQTITMCGATKSTVRMTANGGLTAIGFGMADMFKDVDVFKPDEFDLVGTLSYNLFNGKKSPQIEFIDADLADR